ncbi:hypothetical protein ACI796_20340 [Geodermatophilus sp. SYSU D00525]
MPRARSPRSRPARRAGSRRLVALVLVCAALLTGASLLQVARSSVPVTETTEAGSWSSSWSAWWQRLVSRDQHGASRGQRTEASRSSTAPSRPPATSPGGTTTPSAPAPVPTTPAPTTPVPTTTVPTTPAPTGSASPSTPATPPRTTTPQPAPSTATGPVPNPANTGVPAGWTPATTRTTDLHVTTPGAVVQDVRLVGADLVIDADDVTVRRVEVQGGSITNVAGSRCRNGLLLEDVSVVRAPGQVTGGDAPAVGAGGYTARRVEIDGLPEGFRVAGRSLGCGAVTIEDSFARITSPDRCGDWHGDALQGYDGPALTVRNVTLHMVEADGCYGTAPFFYPAGQGNTSVDVDGLLVAGGGYSFRLGMPGSVRGLRIADGGYGYGPVAVSCAGLTAWEARVVPIGADYQPTGAGRSQSCTGS